MNPFLVACATILMTAPSFPVFGEPLVRDEGESLQTPVDFSPPEEKDLDAQWLKPPEKPFPFPQASIEITRGVRTLAVNGETLPTWMHATGASTLPGGAIERQLREAGMRVFIIDVGLTADYSEERSLATAPEAAFAQFQSRARSVLKSVPDAWFIVRFWMNNVGPDFPEKYPHALLQGENGATDWGFAYLPATRHQTRPNMLNEWRRYCGEHLHRFVHRLGKSAYAPRVAGFYLGAMNTGEWWYYKGEGDPGWDYSPTRKAAFELYARQKYGNDRTAIAKAWGRPDDEKLFALPSLKERQQRSPAPNSASMDYLHVLNQPVTNAARYFAQIIRGATSERSVVGMEIHMGGMTYPNNGTIFLNHLLDTPEIAFFGGPSDYHYRRPGASPLYNIAYSSLAAHGKLWLNEGDLRTPASFDTPGGGAGEPPAEPRAMSEVFKREFARGAVFNYSTYLMDFGWSWFYDPAVLRDIAQLLRADAFLRHTGLERRADVAFVTDQESQLFGNYFANPTLQMLKGKLDQTGLSWDFYELRDLLAEDRFRHYKMIVFLNTCALNDAERSGIEKMKADGRLLFWMYNPGVVDLSQKGRDEAALVSALTGLQMQMGTRPGKIALQQKAFQSLGIEKLPHASLGSDAAVQETRLNREVSLSDTATGLPIGNLPSRIYSVDSEAISLGVDSAERAFFAMRRFPEWTSVYTAFCEVEPWVLRAFARQAGCHIWNEGEDITFAAENYVGLHAAQDGEKTLHFPAKSDVFDLFSGEIIATDVDKVTFPMRRGETRFFYLGAGEAAVEQWKIIATEAAEAKSVFQAANPAATVGEAHFRYHSPTLAETTGELELTGVHRFQAPAVLVAGPYESNEESVKALDLSLSKAPVITGWSGPEIPAETLGTKADRFIHVVVPQATADATAPLQWGALKNPGPWIHDYQLGIATGQSYAVAYQLMAKETAEVRLYIATRGEAALWIDGEVVEPNPEGIFEPLLRLGEAPRQIILRLKGDNLPTGYTFKVVGAHRGLGVYSIAGSGVTSVAPDANALTPPPEPVRLLLPQKTPNLQSTPHP